MTIDKATTPFALNVSKYNYFVNAVSFITGCYRLNINNQTVFYLATAIRNSIHQACCYGIEHYFSVSNKEHRIILTGSSKEAIVNYKFLQIGFWAQNEISLVRQLSFNPCMPIKKTFVQ